MGGTPSTVADRTADRLDRELWWLSGVLVLGAVTTLLDGTIVNVAIGTLGREFHTSLASVQWVITGYLLALSLVIPLSGWAMVRFGARKTWLASQVLFLAGSVLAGAAWSTGSLLFFRVVQGLGGGLLVPVAQAMLAQAAGPRRMGRVMSIASVPAMLAPVIGPVVGGATVDNASWRWIFFLNVPVGLAAIGLSLYRLPATRPSTASPLDVSGLLVLCPGLAALVYGLCRAGAAGGFGSAVTVLGLVGGAALLAVFVAHALRARGRALIDVRLSADRAFGASVATSFLLNASLYGAMILLPLYYQLVRGQSVLRAGLLLAPQGVGYVIAVGVVGRLTDRSGPGRIAPVGIVLALVATIPFAELGPHTNESLLGVAMLLRGLGIGAAALPTMAAAYHSLPRAAIPGATGASNICQRLGASVGTAVLAVVMQRYLVAHVAGWHGSLSAIAPGGAGSLATPLSHAFAASFRWVQALGAAALVTALFLPRRPASAVAAAPGRAPARTDATPAPAATS